MGEHTKKAYFALDGSRSSISQCMFPLNSNMNKENGK